MISKYVKLKSVAWWASMAMLGSGLFIASEPLHELAGAAASLENIYGGLSGAALINAGLLGIGLRGMNG